MFKKLIGTRIAWETSLAISEKRLNQIIPQAYQNLTLACENLIEGLAQGDKTFLQSVMYPYLYSLFKPDLQRMKDSDLNFNMKESSSTQLQKVIHIYPYVLFGGNINDRKQNKEQYTRITTNRYIRHKKENEDMMAYLKQLRSKQIYGFECYYKHKKTYEFLNDNKQVVNTIQIPSFKIKIETDSENEDYYIADIQDYVEKHVQDQQ